MKLQARLWLNVFLVETTAEGSGQHEAAYLCDVANCAKHDSCLGLGIEGIGAVFEGLKENDDC